MKLLAVCAFIALSHMSLSGAIEIFDKEIFLKIEPDRVPIPKHADQVSQITISGWINGTGTASVMITMPDASISNQTVNLAKNGNFYTAFLIDRNSHVGRHTVDISLGNIKKQTSFVIWDDVNKTISILKGASIETCKVNDSCFLPSKFVANVSSIVTWQNLDTVVHVLASDRWTGDPIAPGETFSTKLDTAGENPYSCKIHPWMKGILLVEEPPKAILIETNSGQVSNPVSPISSVSGPVRSDALPRMSISLGKKTFAPSEILQVNISFSKSVSHRVYLTITGPNLNLYEYVDVYGTDGTYKLPLEGKAEGTYRIKSQFQFGGDIQTIEDTFEITKTNPPTQNPTQNPTKEVVEKEELNMTSVDTTDKLPTQRPDPTQSFEGKLGILGGVMGAGITGFVIFRSRKRSGKSVKENNGSKINGRKISYDVEETKISDKKIGLGADT